MSWSTIQLGDKFGINIRLNQYHNFCGHEYNMNTSDLESGGRLNKKDGLTRYGDSHVKDKTS